MVACCELSVLPARFRSPTDDWLTAQTGKHRFPTIGAWCPARTVIQRIISQTSCAPACAEQYILSRAMPRRPSPKVAALVQSLSEPSQDLESLVAAVSAEAAGCAAAAVSNSEAATASGSKSAAGSRRKSNVRPWSSVPASSADSDGNSPPAVITEEPPAEQTSPAPPEGGSHNEAVAEPTSSTAGAASGAGPETAAAEQQQPPATRSRRRLSGGITRSPPGRSRFAAEAQVSRRPSWSDPEPAIPQLVRSEPTGVAGALAEAARAAVDAGTVGERVEQGSNGWRVPGSKWREGLRG